MIYVSPSWLNTTLRVIELPLLFQLTSLKEPQRGSRLLTALQHCGHWQIQKKTFPHSPVPVTSSRFVRAKVAC